MKLENVDSTQRGFHINALTRLTFREQTVMKAKRQGGKEACTQSGSSGLIAINAMKKGSLADPSICRRYRLASRPGRRYNWEGQGAGRAAPDTAGAVQCSAVQCSLFSNIGQNRIEIFLIRSRPNLTVGQHSALLSISTRKLGLPGSLIFLVLVVCKI
jgi:hypothetical protein